MIRAGLVSLDGQVVGKMGAKLKVPESAAPLVDGVPYPPLPLLVAYHKPVRDFCRVAVMLPLLAPAQEPNSHTYLVMHCRLVCIQP